MDRDPEIKVRGFCRTRPKDYLKRGKGMSNHSMEQALLLRNFERLDEPSEELISMYMTN
jgi:hypothetical protein